MSAHTISRTPLVQCSLLSTGFTYCVTHIYCKKTISRYASVSLASDPQYPQLGLRADRLTHSLGSQNASAAGGIIGLMGVTDASVTTASFRLSICPFRPSHLVHTPGVLRNRAYMKGCGWHSAVCVYALTSVALSQMLNVRHRQG